MDWQIDKPIPMPSHVYSNGLLAMKQSPDRAKSLLNVTHRKNHCPEPFPQPATLIPLDITIGTLNPRFPHAALPGMLTGVETARQIREMFRNTDCLLYGVDGRQRSKRSRRPRAMAT